MVDPVTPTRDALRKIVGNDERTLIALERLFQVSGSETPDSLLSIDRRVEGLEQLPLPSNAESIESQRKQITGLSDEFIVFVSSRYDFPLASSGVIQLLDNVTYYVISDIDLMGDRLVGGIDTAIIGTSSETASISSTGLVSGSALISSAWTMPIRHISFSANTIFDLDAAGNAGQALDWYGVNLIGTSDIGTIANYGNFVVNSMAFLESSGLVFDGTMGTVSFANTLFVGTSAGSVLEFPSTAVIERRFRVIYSAISVPAGGTGFDVSTSATIPVEGYILDTCNFSGSGTYLSGVDYTLNEARFIQNRGIVNTSVVTGFYMQGNATTTVITATGTPVKVLGATTESLISQKFDNTTSNRALYQGAIPRNFKVTVVASMSSGNNNDVGVFIAKNGTVIPDSESRITTDSGGRLENGYTQSLSALSDSDYLEVFVDNNTSTSNILVENLNLILEGV